MQDAARQWLAEEQLEAHRAAEPVRRLEAQEAAAAAPPEARPPDANLVKLAATAWAIADRLVVSLAGAQFALTAEERAQLAEPTAAVLEKHLPDVLERLATTPEGVLLGTISLVYGAKAAGAFLAPAAAPEPPAAAPEVAP